MTDPQPISPQRTFRHKASVANVILIITVAAVAFFFFWSRTTTHTLLGLLHTLITLRLIEKVVNTTYRFTNDGLLVIDRGRLSRRKMLSINEITNARVATMRPFGTRIVVLEYGAGHVTSVQPHDCEGFLAELRKRQDRITSTILGDKV